MKILIVEDKEDARLILRTILEGVGYGVEEATNGREALTKLRAGSFDMIISDILMPVMDGFQFCRFCKEDETLKKIPFVFYTATYTDAKDEAFAYKIGADRFLLKPMDSDVLIGDIREMIEMAGQGLIKASKPVEKKEEETYKLYSERLVKKLEKKMQELETELARRKEAEKEILKLTRVVEQSPNIVMITDPEGKIEYVNPKFEEITGYSVREVLGKNALDLGEQPEEKPGTMFAQLNSGEDWRGIFYNRKKSGERYWEKALLSPLFDEKGSITHFVKVAEDITEQRRREREITQERSRMSTILSALDTGLSLINRDKTISWVNEKTKKMFPGKNPLGLICHVFFEGSQNPCNPCPTMMAFQTGKVKEAEKLNEKDGRWYNILSQPVKDRDGIVAEVLEAVTDITPRKEIEVALKKSEERFKTLFELAPDIFFLINPEGLLLDGNNKVEELTGYKKEELIGRGFWETGLHSPEDRARALARFEKDRQGIKTGPEEFEFVRKDGRAVPVEISTIPVKMGEEELILGIARDVSQRKQLEQQLMQAQKMEVIGTLAGGVAHDFNNILTTIIGNTDFLMSDCKEDGHLKEVLEEILKAGQRGAVLTRQLLAFSRKQVIQPRVVDINEVVEESKNMLKRLLRENIELRTVLKPNLWHILFDPGQFEQILMNLAVNASDAMPEGGALVIETENIHLDGFYFQDHGVEAMPGPYVMITVSDTGLGIDKEIRDRIFEPFFTTKERSKGAGLGLSTVYGIVKQNEGYIWDYSESGRGTTFKIYLPRTKDEGGLCFRRG